MPNNHKTGDHKVGDNVVSMTERLTSSQEVAREKPKRLREVQKRRMVLDLRAAGLSHEQISEQLGKLGYHMSTGMVAKTLDKALKLVVQEHGESVEQIRALELVRIDQAISVLWPKVKDGNLKAMREYRAFIDQRARLMGSYAAVKHEISGDIRHVLDDTDRQEIERLEEAFLTAGGIDIPDADVVELPPSPEELGLPDDYD